MFAHDCFCVDLFCTLNTLTDCVGSAIIVSRKDKPVPIQLYLFNDLLLGGVKEKKWSERFKLEISKYHAICPSISRIVLGVVELVTVTCFSRVTRADNLPLCECIACILHAHNVVHLQFVLTYHGGIGAWLSPLLPTLCMLIPKLPRKPSRTNLNLKPMRTILTLGHTHHHLIQHHRCGHFF